MRYFFTASLYVIFTICISFLLHAQTAEVACYAPDGKTVAPNDSFVPCNKLGITQAGAASSCCLLDGDVGTRDLCASTGLCVNGGIIRREFCTDRTWNNPACVKVCTDPSSGGNMSGPVEMTPCTDGTFCCGHNNLTCCGTKYAVTVPTLSLVASGSNTSATTTATITATPNPGIAAVAGLGIGLGVALLVASGFIIYLARKNKILKKDNRALAVAVHQSFEAGSSGDGGDYRHMSFLPPSSTGTPSNAPAATASVRGSRVPSMQEFAAFKAMYETLQYQNGNGNGNGNANTNRLSELDATQISAVAAAQQQHFRNSTTAAPPAFEQIREEPHDYLGTPGGNPVMR